MNKTRRTAVAVLLALSILFPGYAEEPDSVSTKLHAIEEVEVTAHRLSRKVSATVPAQSMGRDMLDAIAAQNAADAVRHFAGTNVRDYGGIGG